MKKLLALLAAFGLFTGVAQADIVLIDFDDADSWDLSESNAGSYGEKGYSDQGWDFTASDGAIRENLADRFQGTYSWRLRGQDWLAENTTAADYSGFSIEIRPWGDSEPTASAAWSLEYSVNSGADWTLVNDSIQGQDPLAWTTYSATFDETSFAAGEFQVRLTSSGNPGSNDNRINVDNFTAIPEPGTMVLLVVGMFGAAAMRRKLHQ